jgi:hypothetical protein
MNIASYFIKSILKVKGKNIGRPLGCIPDKPADRIINVEAKPGKGCWGGGWSGMEIPMSNPDSGRMGLGLADEMCSFKSYRLSLGRRGGPVDQFLR